ncbi:McrC family protein [Clostridium sp.]|uniref:McrC family protein n=1 Tax=Clostridium sp. TaxID=1506 RepID=UPI003D6CE87D
MNSEVITIFEDNQIKMQLTEKQKKDMLGLKDLWGTQNLSIQADGTVIMKHYVGFVVSGETRIQILPKIYSKDSYDKDKEAREACELLLRLLSYSGYLSIKEIPKPQTIEGCKNDLLEIFITMFIDKFLKLFCTDPHRQYETTEENLQFIKGKILFQKSLLKNIYTNHLHYVEYEEFTIDTVLNRIFKTIFLKLIYVTKINSSKVKIKLALTYLEDVNIIALSPIIFNSIKFNRLNEKYKPLYNFAKLFYYNQQPGFKNGDENVFTFLVPLNKLFEYYLFKLLKGAYINIEGKECKVNYQKPQRYLGEYQGEDIFLMKPDITVTEGNNVKVILDAKYKKIAARSDSFVSQSDIYQMIGYASHYKCKDIFLVYPAYKYKDKLEKPITIKVKVFNEEVNIRIIEVDILNENIEETRLELLNSISNLSTRELP